MTGDFLEQEGWAICGQGTPVCDTSMTLEGNESSGRHQATADIPILGKKGEFGGDAVDLGKQRRPQFLDRQDFLLQNH